MKIGRRKETMVEYEGVMDKECIKLCDALNKLKGIHTTESCCGHYTEEFNIWFVADNLEALPPLLYFFDSCHCGFSGWRVIAKTDCSMSPVVFNIEGPAGAFGQANKIAEMIEQDIADRAGNVK